MPHLASKYISCLMIILLGFIHLNGQENNCNLVKWKKEYKKQKNPIYKADKAMLIADCLREAKDSTAQDWYSQIIELHKNNRVCDGPNRWETKPTYQIAVSYYWLNQDEQAEVWLEKAIISKNEWNSQQAKYGHNKEQLLYYYYGKLLLKRKQYKKALSNFNKFKTLEGDTLDVKILIEQCSQNLK